MIKFFLRAKHWQLFLILFVLPFIVNMIFMGSMMTKVAVSNGPEDFVETFQVFKWFPLLLIIGTFGTFGWIVSVGVGLHKYVPKSAGMRLGLFKILMAIAIGYFLFFSIWMSSLFSEMSVHVANDTEPDPSMFKWLGIIIPMHFLSIFAMIYALWFNAKSFKSIELGKEAHSSDYIGHFFLFWFSFIGVWIIQPTINKIVDGTIDPPTDSAASNGKATSENRDLLD
ncbi:MAG: hypothetical protein ACJA1C_000401 [Crocinitomicaceae bacterium]|jgi:hypothetical protein